MLLKKITTTFLLLTCIKLSFAQDFQMTIVAGSSVSSVKAVIRPGQQIDGQISSAQVSFIIPTSIGPRPTASIVNNFVPGVSYAMFESTETLSDGDYYVWEFDGTGGAAVPNITYAAGTPYDLLEVQFAAALTATSQVRLAQLPNGGVSGGSPGNYNFYLALSGTDVVNQTAQFYGANFFNDGNGYTGYSWARLDGLVLPVKFTSFTAISNNNNADLRWTVENEGFNTDHYEVERSLDGIHFANIAAVPAKNNGIASNIYILTDHNIIALRSQGIVYYRIRQIDRDGRFIYTEIRSIKIGKEGFYVSIYPNPVTDGIHSKVNLFLEQTAMITVSIIDVAGKIVRTENIGGIEGANSFDLNMNKLAAGTYYVKITAGTNTQTVPVIRK